MLGICIEQGENEWTNNLFLWGRQMHFFPQDGLASFSLKTSKAQSWKIFNQPKQNWESLWITNCTVLSSTAEPGAKMWLKVKSWRSVCQRSLMMSCGSVLKARRGASLPLHSQLVLSILCSSETRLKFSLKCRNGDETLCSNQTDKSVLFFLHTAASEQSLQSVEGSITSSSITSNDHK